MKRFAALLILLLLSSRALAQSEEPVLPDELRGVVNTIIEQAINGVTVFTSHNTVSSGKFTIDQADEPNNEAQVLRLPASFDIYKKEDYTIFLEGLLGYFKATEQIPPGEGDGPNDFSRIKTWSAGLGLGVRFDPIENLSIAPAFSATYAYTRNYYDYNNEFSQTVILPYGKQVFGWNVKTMTYSPSLKVQYELPIGKPTLRFWTKYSHLFNDSIQTNSPVIDINSDTGLWQNSIGIKLPISATADGSERAIKTALTRTDIYRSGRQGLDFGYFYELSAYLVKENKDAKWPFRELGLGLSYSFGENISGWRAAIGYDF